MWYWTSRSIKLYDPKRHLENLQLRPNNSHNHKPNNYLATSRTNQFKKQKSCKKFLLRNKKYSRRIPNSNPQHKTLQESTSVGMSDKEKNNSKRARLERNATYSILFEYVCTRLCSARN